MIADGLLQIEFPYPPKPKIFSASMKKYYNVPMSLADACLVRMSELKDNAVVFTIDSDFQIYRKNDKKLIPVIIS